MHNNVNVIKYAPTILLEDESFMRIAIKIAIKTKQTFTGYFPDVYKDNRDFMMDSIQCGGFRFCKPEFQMDPCFIKVLIQTRYARQISLCPEPIPDKDIAEYLSITKYPCLVYWGLREEQKQKIYNSRYLQ